MNKLLVMYAFAKAEQEIKKRGIIKPSLTQMATLLSDYLEEQEGFSLGEKSLRVYRGAAEKLIPEDEDISIKQIAVIHGLCRYLGYEDYQNFVQSTGEENTKPEIANSGTRNKMKTPVVIAVLSILFITALLLYNYSNKQRWMVWQGDHYVEVDFDANKYRINQLKLYKEDRVMSFKKVVVSCDTVFFNDDQSVRFWYGKNKQKELEYFTDLGLHPETGKTLKPITSYMINKHICK